MTLNDLTDILKKHVILISDGLLQTCEEELESIENRNQNSEFLKELKQPEPEYTPLKDFYHTTT